jgi:hypothetical protein
MLIHLLKLAADTCILRLVASHATERALVSGRLGLSYGIDPWCDSGWEHQGLASFLGASQAPRWKGFRPDRGKNKGFVGFSPACSLDGFLTVEHANSSHSTFLPGVDGPDKLTKLYSVRIFAALHFSAVPSAPRGSYLSQTRWV